MGAWVFWYWLLVALGLLWVKRRTGELRCNIFSAALAALIFISVYVGCCYLVLHYMAQLSDGMMVLVFLFMWAGLIPTASFLTLFLGHWFIPWFRINMRELERLTAYLMGWTIIALIIVSMLQFLGFLLMAALFGGGAGLPRMTSRITHDHYHHW
jgi:cation transporter-like permease